MCVCVSVCLMPHPTQITLKEHVFYLIRPSIRTKTAFSTTVNGAF